MAARRTQESEYLCFRPVGAYVHQMQCVPGGGGGGPIKYSFILQWPETVERV